MCNCCRLAKCFRVGMQKSLILSKAEKEGRKDVVQQNREKRAQAAKKVRSILVRMIYILQKRFQTIVDQQSRY